MAGDRACPFLLLVLIVLNEHGMLPTLSPDLIQLLLEPLLFTHYTGEVVRICVVQFLPVFTELALAAIERFALFAKLVHLCFVISLMKFNL